MTTVHTRCESWALVLLLGLCTAMPVQASPSQPPEPEAEVSSASLAPVPAEAQMLATKPAAVESSPTPMWPMLNARQRSYLHPRLQPLQDVDGHAAALLPYAALATEVYCDAVHHQDPGSKKCPDQGPAAAYGWKPIKRYPNDLAGHHDFQGMVFSTHYRVLGPDLPVEIAVAFRGTNFRSPADWRANLRWFVPGRDQYNVLADRVHAVVQEAQEQALEKLMQEPGGRAPAHGFRMVTTGHSLGGGLAQMFAHKSQQVKAAVVFDPSPVTGFHSCVGHDEVNCQVPVWRVYEQGEVLAYVRALTRQFYVLSENITELEFSLLGGNALFNHDMSRFYDSLAKYLAARPVARQVSLFEPRLDCTCLVTRRPNDLLDPVLFNRCEQLQALRAAPGVTVVGDAGLQGSR